MCGTSAASGKRSSTGRRSSPVFLMVGDWLLSQRVYMAQSKPQKRIWRAVRVSGRRFFARRHKYDLIGRGKGPATRVLTANDRESASDAPLSRPGLSLPQQESANGWSVWPE